MLLWTCLQYRVTSLSQLWFLAVGGRLMCRACDETPDGVGRRCSREEGFTPVESDTRNRMRNLTNARAALARGDAQGAANSLAHSLSAQRSLDGGPPVPVTEPSVSATPHRDFIVSPSDVDVAQTHLAQVNAQRASVGQPPLAVEVTRQQRPTGADPMTAWEQATIRVSGHQGDLDALSLGRVRTGAEKRVSTMGVLAASCAAVRLNGGRYTPRTEGPNSTPGQVDAYVADSPGGSWRSSLAPTAEDQALAREVRAWARVQAPTSDYLRAVRHSVGEDYLSPRSVGTASSAVGLYLSARARTGASVPAGPDTGPRGSRHFNKVGDLVVTTARVDKVVPIRHESRPMPHYLYIMETPDGDKIRWMANDTEGLEVGDSVTLRGVVKGHSEYRNEKQTEMTRCQVRIHSSKSA